MTWIRALVLIGFVALPVSAFSSEYGKPTWEVGFGVAPISFPEYRGSSRQRHYVLPMPYLIYRGDFLRVDREGIRGLLLETRNVDIDLSIDGTVPVASDDDGLRQGMPDLDPVFEVGPSVNWTLLDGDTLDLQFKWPVRSVFATDFRQISHVGWTTHPHIHMSPTRGVGGWNFSVSSGPLWADSRYHGYYYSVPQEFATATRPGYEAQAGYSGWMSRMALSRRFERFWVGAFLRYDNMQGAEFGDSPLVDSTHSLMVGAGVAWILAGHAQ